MKEQIMDVPVRPRPPKLKPLPVLPPQFIHRGEQLEVIKRLSVNKTRRLDKLAKQFVYFRGGYEGSLGGPVIELGNKISPAGQYPNPHYKQVLEIYNEIAYDNECRLIKHEQDMVKYREYVEKYRAWRIAEGL